ncbi:hypothetical protein ACJZ2D_000683 [Fusarium nematophilum]
MEHTPKSNPLPFAGDEVEAVFEACKLMSVKPVQPTQRTTESVLSLFGDCDIFHFAGHGFTDVRDSSRSHLRLQNWMDNSLTVADVVATNLRERKPFLAYLSACGTRQIEEAKHFDERVHLISGCQLTGFRHVVCTLCEVNDEICVDIARITYGGIRKGDMTDESVGQGLHNAVREMRDRWRDGLTGATRGGKKRKAATRRERRFTHEINEAGGEADGRESRKDKQRDDRLARDASHYDSENEDHETAFLNWAPFVHYGC